MNAINTDAPTEKSWFKSSYSSQDNGNCVETTARSAAAAAHSGIVGVRDSKQQNGPALAFTHTAWTTFVAHIHNN
ncbi:DUF397 domain-containing protein [Streptomyces sp. NPDC054784]